jgi:predicted dehydrogenase
MDEIGAAIVGTGFMGPAHTEALRRIGVRVVGILGSSAVKSRRAAESLGIPKAYSSYEELLADGEVRSVHIATPNRFHFSMARDALNAGKHVLCEKPLAMDSQESGDLVALAARHPELATGVNYNMRFYPLCLEAFERIGRGDIGQVHAIYGSYVQDWLLYPTDYNWRVLDTEGGALRVVADIGTHWLDLLQFITGLRVEAVLADLKMVHPVRQRPGGEVETFKGSGSPEHQGKAGPAQASEPVSISTEDCASVLLRFAGGAVGSLWVSQVTAGRKNCLRYEISGSEGTLAWNSETPNELWVGRRNRANEVLLKDPSLLGDAAGYYTSYPGGHNEGYPDSFKQCFRAFYERVAGGEPGETVAYPTFADGHREILLCEAILASHRRARWFKVPA